MIKIKIKFFGILNDYFKEIILEKNSKISLNEIKSEIKKKYINNTNNYLLHTIEKSIFSNKKKILNENKVINKTCTIFLLPPFSGG